MGVAGEGYSTVRELRVRGRVQVACGARRGSRSRVWNGQRMSSFRFFKKLVDDLAEILEGTS